MVDGVFSIPLSGLADDSSRAPTSSAGLPGEFVAGAENLLLATALHPYLDGSATHYSPLVLYGSQGSGKTHLAYGLSNWWRQHFPSEAVWYLAGSEFVQAHASAVETGQLDSWRCQLRGLSLLIVDDLCQLAGKASAQHELLVALDYLADRGAAVVVTARTLPTHLTSLASALRGRLSGGLAVPVSLPGRDVRRAILRKIAAGRALSLPENSIHKLADALEVGAAALAGIVAQLDFKARVDGVPLEQRDVLQFVSEHRRARVPSLADIAGLTAKYFSLRLADLKSPLRRQPVVAGRGVAMYLARRLTDKSLDQIGQYFGGRDHTTVLHNCRRIERLLERDRATRVAIAELKRFLDAL